MIVAADFDEVYMVEPCKYEVPVCEAPNCFIGSYPPVSKIGELGPFHVNTKFLEPNRYAETLGHVTVRSVDFKC